MAAGISGEPLGGILEAVFWWLGAFSGPLGPVVGFLGGPWEALRRLLVTSGALKDRRSRNVGSCSLYLAPLGAVLGASWAPLGQSWGPFGAISGPLGPSWGDPGGLLGRLWPSESRKEEHAKLLQKPKEKQ